MKVSRLLVLLISVVMLLSASISTVYAAKPIRDVSPKDTGSDYNKGEALKIGTGEKLMGQPPIGPAKVGAVRTWLALDDARGSIYLKNYTLRATGQHVEIWVANNLNFPANDCRNDGVRNVVTTAQAQYLAGQFDNNIYPIESEAFSVPPDRNGQNAFLPTLIPNLPSSEYKGEGDNIVVLVDNVRDDNYYDTNNAHTFSYIAGFFYSVFNEYFNRNVMSIDSWDWVHRTGAAPPNSPTEYPCTSAPARPFLYEGVFAHEYQHLLEYYEDTDEVNWVNEGLSDFAIDLTGYGDPSLPITDVGFDSHIQCFLGWLGVLTPANPIPRPASGPENSLTNWGDQGDGEILCDYGAAYSFMELLNDRFGLDFMSELHRNDANGFAGLNAVLSQFGASDFAQDLVHEWAAAVALDGILDDGASLTGGTASDFQVEALNATINWDTVHAYNTSGAPPNGSDYVRLRARTGAYLGAGSIGSISFDGSGTLPSLPVEWTVDATAHDGPAFYSGQGDNLDRMIAMSVAVPAVSPTLTFDAQWQTEATWDFGYVQVSTNGGETWTSLSTADTSSVHDPGAIQAVVDNLPGFSGDSGGWRAQTADLSGYAGTNVILAFRYITDPSVTEPGFWVDNIAINGTLVSAGSDGSSLAGWQSQTQIFPVPVNGFTVQLIAYNNAAAWIGELALDANFDGTISGAALDALIGTTAQTVAAIVTYDEPTESVTQYAPYVLTVDRVVQPGG